MRLPGFTAERAVSERNSIWGVAAPASAKMSDSKIIPQFCFQHPGGYTTCCYCDPYAGCYCFPIHHPVYY
jgi:hypothetical protein